ncbi:MAG: SRPBCC domain-containing protein [Archangiaceae bacterium]|nr:SRPBCC domain-containing protein [Archangiaceae bacterium]
MSQRIARSIVIAAPAQAVWQTLTRPELMRRWMGEPEMNIEVETDWAVGGPITVRGFHHTQFTDTGTVLLFEPCTALRYTHLSSVSRLPDVPESYTTLDFRLAEAGGGTTLSVTLTGFPTEVIFKHLDFYWRGTLAVVAEHALATASGGSR